MLKGLSLKERCLQTTLVELASGLPICSKVSGRSMLVGALNFANQSFRTLLSSHAPGASPEFCPDSSFSGTKTQNVSGRRLSVKISATEKDISKITAPALEATKGNSSAAPRRARQQSPKSSPAKLTEIRGVGPKNAQLLAAAGYADLRAVQQVYLSECSRNQQLFREHLQSVVGIKHNAHQAMIAKFIQESAEAHETLQQGAEIIRPNNVTLSVEGNISAGKSTFLKGITDHCPDLQSLMHVSPEPVDRWQKVNASNGRSYNLLDEFYHDKKRFAYIFQNYIFFTRMMQEKESGTAMAKQPYRLLERSIFCDRMVFVESLKDSQYLSEMELTIYDSWFDPIVEMCQTLVPDGFIYLRAQPDTCMNRMMKRSRNEETGVGIEYLQDLHQRHEDWLCSELKKGDDKYRLSRLAQGDPIIEKPGYQDAQAASIKRIVENAFKIPRLPDLIASDVKFLNKDNNNLLHSTIHTLPALVLDCEKDILDIDAQKEHANKVNCYFEYVKETRKQRAIAKALEQPMKEQSAMANVENMLNGMMKGVSLVPKEFQSELQAQIGLALRHSDLEVRTGSQLVGLA